jgi:rhodanese-related sulfurtransferase
MGTIAFPRARFLPLGILLAFVLLLSLAACVEQQEGQETGSAANTEDVASSAGDAADEAGDSRGTKDSPADAPASLGDSLQEGQGQPGAGTGDTLPGQPGLPETPGTASPMPAQAHVTAQALFDRLGLEPAPLVIDLRLYSKYAAGHVPAAISVPVQHLKVRTGQISRERDIVLVTATEQDAANAWDILMGLGYDPQRIGVMADNLEAWAAAGYPQEKPPPRGC